MSKKTETNSLIDRIKKMHSAVSIEKKDYSFKDLFKDNESVTLEIQGLATKFVPKYAKEENAGYHTTVYLKNGEKTGCFSGALLEFANFFYSNANMDTKADFNKITFDGSIIVKVTKIKLDGGRSTYNFEIVDGVVNGIERMGKLEGQAGLLLGEGNITE